MNSAMDAPAAASVAVVGGGAAGLMAAIWSARAGARTVLLEGSRSCGLKILVSGGGRCNVLPSVASDDDFFTAGSRNVLRRLFRTWPLPAVRAFFERDLGIALVEEPATGKLFPREQSARLVRDRLVEAVRASGGTVHEGWRVAAVERGAHGEFRLHAAHGAMITADRLILATGGKSLPKTGSDGAGYDLARAFGHTILAPYPALVPLTTEDAAWRSLTGIAVVVRWRAFVDGAVREERVRELLFTHRGFSGPAILDASHWAVRDGARIEVAWGAKSAADWEAVLQEHSKRAVANALAELLPRRLAEVILEKCGIDGATQGAQLRKEERRRLFEALLECPLPVAGNEGFRTSEVTGGGVPLGEVEPSTLESRCASGLFLCGEILDAIGRIGGHNFLWAWVTGRLAARSAALQSAVERSATPHDR